MVVWRVKSDEEFMIELCDRVDSSLFNPSPNPKVGCLIIRDGIEVGFGIHQEAGSDHAEVIALKAAGENSQGATVYVTLEPCNHFGKTPPCADALIAAGIKKVVYAIADPTVAAGGAEKLKSSGIKVVSGVGEVAAKSALQPWLTNIKKARPFIRLKFAQTRDGFIAREDGSSKWITNEESRGTVHHLRAISDAVIVGTKTALVDEPQLDARIDGVVRQPVGYVVGTSALPKTHLRQIETRDIGKVIERLKEEGVTSALLEGGAELAQAFLDADLVDEIWVFTSETVFGHGITAPKFDPNLWRAKKQRSFGSDSLTIYEHA
ncbi:MAG: hypothetical protein RLZZ330_1209 [Actinomycetota bacterium]|jgi:diaminohydroxyphosphoribosylaminopyrimidine deaminase/5-amino-6-(5-phosphoribosylamino)uracil reductase